MTGFTYVWTEDGTVLLRDPITGISVSGRTLADALAELRRRLSHVHARAARGAQEGLAA
jgi:hypothetical protein